MNEISVQSSHPSTIPRGCIFALLLVIFGGWNLLVSSVFIGWNAAMEQGIMMSVPPQPDQRVFLVLGLGLAVSLPAALLWLIVHDPVLRRIARVLALGGLMVLFLAPSRLAGIQQSQLGAAIQLAGLAGYFLVIWLIARGGGWRLTRPSWDGLGWALAIGAILGVPWALWCALGSSIDTLLAFLVALVASAVFVFAWEPGENIHASPQTYAPFLLNGLLGALALIPICAALGNNGSAAMLALAVPWLAWVAAALIHRDIVPQRSSWLAAVLVLGFGLFWPLAFVDLEEISGLLASPGEAIQWVWMAGGVEVFLAAGAALVAVVLMQFWLTNKVLRIAGIFLGGLAGVILVGVYFLTGQSGFYGERLFVIFKDQADLSFSASIVDPKERRSAVYQRLVDHAEGSQGSLRESLKQRGLRYTPYYLVNAIEVQGDPLLAGWLRSRPEVDRVLINTRLRPLPQPLAVEGGFGEEPGEQPGWNLTLIQADRVWQELGVTGKGILIGQSDSGAESSHPELADGYRKYEQTNNYSWYDPWNGSMSPTDLDGHGTHTLGSVLGNRVGVAPDAEWIGCVNLGRNLANPAFYLDCMQFHLAPFPQSGDPFYDGRPEWGAQVLNNSWGCPPIEGCDAAALQAGAAALRAAGVFVAVSAGNDGEGGQCGTVADPLALYADVFSVGALDADGELASFSSLGPVSIDGSGRLKPDIAAPGVNVLSAFPGGGYASFSGTSMAGPHVAGVVALMWSANPALIGDIARTEQILRETASPYTGHLPECVVPSQPNNAAGYGILDAYAAVQAAFGVAAKP